MRNIVGFWLLSLGGLLGCVGEVESPVCLMELDLRNHERKGIAENFDLIAEDLGLDSNSYSRVFPSGTDITVGFLEFNRRAVASLVETEEYGIFMLALYPEIRDGLDAEVVSAVANIFGVKLELPVSCE